MGRSRNRGRSEIEFLKGKVRELEKELKYYRKREHFFEQPTEEIDEVQDIRLKQCKECKRGPVIEYDFLYGTLKKCETCGSQEYKKKKT